MTRPSSKELVGLCIVLVAGCGGGGGSSHKSHTASSMHPMPTPEDVAFLYEDKSMHFTSDGTTINAYTDWYYKDETKQMAANVCRLTQGDASQPIDELTINVYDGTGEQLLAHTDSDHICRAG